MSRTMDVHLRYNSWYISFLCKTGQFPSLLTTEPATANFLYFYLELNALVAYSAGASFNTVKHTE